VIETLIRRGCQVTVLTPFLNYGPSVGVTHLVELMKYFLQHDCDLRTTATLTAIAGGRASFSNALSGKQGSDSFDFVVAGVHPRPDKVLYEMLRRKWPRVLMAGDVVAPRTAMESFREGDRAGRSLQ
jgi:hypothetical protein